MTYRGFLTFPVSPAAFNANAVDAITGASADPCPAFDRDCDCDCDCDSDVGAAGGILSPGGLGDTVEEFPAWPRYDCMSQK